jgi:hypothetical protein
VDTAFWLGIVLGAVVSLMASFAANLYTDTLRSYLAKRSQLRLSNRRAKEIDDYKLVKMLRSGDPLARLEIQGRRDSGLRNMLWALLFSQCMIAFVVIRFMRPELYYIVIVVAGVAGLMSSVAMVLSFAISTSTRSLLLKAKKIEEYEQQIRNEWGEDAIEQT